VVVSYPFALTRVGRALGPGRWRGARLRKLRRSGSSDSLGRSRHSFAKPGV